MIKTLLALVLSLFAATIFAATEVNSATQAELESVKGIGPAISTKILDERKKALFKDWGDLVSRVKGVGDKNSAEFSAAGLTVNGTAQTGAPATAAGARKTDKTSAKASVPMAATPPAAATKTAPAAAATTAVATPAAMPAASGAMSAAEKKAAAKQQREDKKAAKAEAKSAKQAAKAASGTMK